MPTVKNIGGRVLRRLGVDPRRLRARISPSPEAGSDWYNDAYSESAVYAAHYAESPYMPVWEAIAGLIETPTSILEIGCGPGQLAHMLDEKGLVTDYTGFDVSNVAIDSARTRLPERHFVVDDAYKTDLVPGSTHDLVLCTEVLEHLTRDIDILKRVPKGRRVIATVPDFPSETHVRWFKSSSEARRRYKRCLRNLEVIPISSDGWTIFVLDGVAR